MSAVVLFAVLATSAPALARPGGPTRDPDAFSADSPGPAAETSTESLTLDPTFSSDGRNTANFGPNVDVGQGVAIDSLDRIVVVGQSGSRIGVVRFLSGGTLDTAFSTDGKLQIDITSGDDGAFDVAIDDADRIVVAGRAGGAGGRFVVLRLNPNGTPDLSFSGDGRVLTDFSSGEDFAMAVAIQDDGDIVASGSAATGNGSAAVVRYTTDGVPDPAFSADGKLTTGVSPTAAEWAADVGIDSQGRIVVTGGSVSGPYTTFLVRYEEDGSRDTSFSGDGRVTSNWAPGFEYGETLAIEADDEIVIGGEVSGGGGQISLARYRVDGTPDPAFSQNGQVAFNPTPREDVATGIALDANGKVVVGAIAGFAPGDTGVMRVFRVTTAGTLDSGSTATITFGDPPDAALDLAIQDDGKYVAAGVDGGVEVRFAVARLIPT